MTAAVAAAVMAGILDTSRQPQPARAAADRPAAGTAVPVFSDADREQLARWQETGFVRRLSEASHEVWVDGKSWRALARAEREARVRKLSLYFRSVEGTRQVMVRESGSNAWLADFFADVLRTE